MTKNFTPKKTNNAIGFFHSHLTLETAKKYGARNLLYDMNWWFGISFFKSFLFGISSTHHIISTFVYNSFMLWRHSDFLFERQETEREKKMRREKKTWWEFDLYFDKFFVALTRNRYQNPFHSFFSVFFYSNKRKCELFKMNNSVGSIMQKMCHLNNIGLFVFKPKWIYFAFSKIVRYPNNVDFGSKI